MKFLILCALLLIEVKATWDTEDEECVNELHLNKDAIKHLEEQDIYPVDNADFNKFLECLGKHHGVLKGNCEFDWDKVDDVLVVEFEKEFGDDPKLSEFIGATIIFGAVEECKRHATGGCGEKIAKLLNCVVKTVIQLSEEKQR